MHSAWLLLSKWNYTDDDDDDDVLRVRSIFTLRRASELRANFTADSIRGLKLETVFEMLPAFLFRFFTSGGDFSGISMMNFHTFNVLSSLVFNSEKDSKKKLQQQLNDVAREMFSSETFPDDNSD